MFDEEIKINNEPPKEPRKPPTLLIFGIAMIGGTVIVALGFRTLVTGLSSLGVVPVIACLIFFIFIVSYQVFKVNHLDFLYECTICPKMCYNIISLSV